jgi:hypothetical protein
MKIALTLLTIIIISSFAMADDVWIEESKAVKIMEKQLDKSYDEIHQMGDIYLAYPYGYGVPEYVGHFKAVSKNADKNKQSRVVCVGVNAITKRLKTIWQADSGDYYNATLNFLDSGFVKRKAEEMDPDGRSVGMVQLMTCGGKYPYLDCLDMASPFWLIHFEDADDYMFYYVSGKWLLISVSRKKQERIDLLKKIHKPTGQ